MMPSVARRAIPEQRPGAGSGAREGAAIEGAGRPLALVPGALLLLVTGVGLAIRLIPTVRWPLWLDESLTWSGSAATLADYLLWRHHPEHPPLYYMLSSLSLRLFGASEWALRLPSLLASVASIPVGYFFVRGALGRAAGLAFAALLAVDPVLVFQGHNARMYSLFALLTLLSLWLACRLCHRDAGWRGWLLLGAVIGAAIWTHNLGLLLWIAVPVGLLLAAAFLPRGGMERRRWGRGALLTATAGLLFTAPILLNAAHRAKSGLVSPDPQLLDATQVAFGFLRRMTDIYWLDQVAFLAGIAGVVLLVRRRGPLGWVMAALMSLTFAFVVVAALKRPEAGLAKYLIPWRLCFLAGLSYLTSVAVERRRSRGLALLALAVLVAGCLRHLPSAPDGAFRAGAMVRDLQGQLRPGDDVICYPAFVEPLCRFYGIRARQETCAPRASDDVPEGSRRLWLVVAHARAGDPGLADRIRACAAEFGVSDALGLDDFDGCHPSVMKVLITAGRIRYRCPDENPAVLAGVASHGARPR